MHNGRVEFPKRVENERICKMEEAFTLKIRKTVRSVLLHRGFGGYLHSGSIRGTVNGIGWTGTTTSYGITYFTCSTTIGRSASYGDMKQVQAQYTMLNGFYKDLMQTSYSTAENSITYECFHTPSMGDQHAYHGVNIGGNGQSGTSWA